MRRRVSQNRAVGADDGLDTGHPVHRPERGETVRGQKSSCTGGDRKRGRERNVTCCPICTAPYSRELRGRIKQKYHYNHRAAADIVSSFLVCSVM